MQSCDGVRWRSRLRSTAAPFQSGGEGVGQIGKQAEEGVDHAKLTACGDDDRIAHVQNLLDEVYACLDLHTRLQR
jgi:hypothetical protein